ncbi:MAG: putative zinc-binding peptidase [Flavitalea sp.]
MKLYACSNCKNPLYFENNICLNCRHTVGFDSIDLLMITLASKNGVEFTNVSNQRQVYRFCKNAEYGTCNWLVPISSASSYCLACSLNRVIPALTSDANLKRWKNIEVAKHRLVYSLLRLRLPVLSKEKGENGIAFDFMADASPVERVMTGHDNGTITLNIEEADEDARVRHKLDLGEKYRTLLGHFRHEIGHYYWEILIKDHNPLQQFRKIFGDEQKDYSMALESYYQTGAPANWSEFFISPYATSHPWEDWAETWAHYLHMMDTLETAYAFGIRINPSGLNDEPAIKASIMKDPYVIADFERIMKWWLPLSFAVNSLNRSMGHADFYPFVISAPIVAKLKFIHELCFAGNNGAAVK